MVQKGLFEETLLSQDGEWRVWTVQMTRKPDQQVQRPCGRRCFQDSRRKEVASQARGVPCMLCQASMIVSPPILNDRCRR